MTEDLSTKAAGHAGTEFPQTEEILQLFYNMPFIGMAVTSPNSKKWVAVNDRLCSILGYPRDELVELTWAQITHPDDLDADLMEFQRVMSGVTDGYAMDKRFIRKSGATIDATIDVRCVRHPDGSVKFFVATVQDISLRKAQEQHIRHLAHHDLLTDLPNRTLLADRLRQALHLARRNKTHFALLFLDLDRFKPVNDRWGHDVGDELLKAVAARLSQSVRASDTVARMGGDEFVLLIAPIESNADALQVAQKIHDAIRQPFPLGQERIAEISSSIGIAVFPEHGDQAEALLQHADQAMYQAKASGRDRLTVFT